MFAETLRKLRLDQNLTQKQLAKLLYISPASISQYETGRSNPSRETLSHIAQYFGVSVDYLMSDSKIAEIEDLMLQEYCDGETVSAVLTKLMCIKGNDRKALLTILEALAFHSSQR